MSACPVCGGAGEPRLRTPDRNRGIGDEHFEYRSCRTCASLFLADVPADLGRYYPPSYYPLGAAGEANAVERAKVALLRRFAGGGLLVEIGPGAGGFAAEAARSGFEVTAIEMDERACRHLREDLGVCVIRSDAPHDALAGVEPADAIVLWHVLEHLTDPVALLRAAAASLRPGGVLLIAVPNPKAFGLRVLGARWAHIDAPRHRVLIPAATLIARAREQGLDPVALTGGDRAGRDWNVFAWQQALLTPASGPRRRRAAFYVGALAAAGLAPIERAGLRGSTYTAVFRHHGAR